MRGLTLENSTLKVLKALAELENATSSELLERIVLHAFEGKVAFSGEVLQTIQKLKQIYGLTSTATESKRASKVRKK